jgi:hypothetical protein
MLHTPRWAHRALALVIASGLAACGHQASGVRIATLAKEVPVTEAFITPPPGGPAVVSVLETRYANALAQDIVLANSTATAGQNLLVVRAFGPMGADAGRARLPDDVPDVATIRRELRERFPNVHMEVSGLYVQNRYGPFGYATGRARGVNCLYAWQRIAARERLLRFETGAITWRLRVCDGNTSMRTLLLLAYGLTINGYFLSERWNPYGDPPAPDPRIGQPGETILPQQVVDPTVIAPEAVGARRRAAARPQARAAATARAVPVPRPARDEPFNEPLPGAAVVPRPERTDLSEPEVLDSNLPEIVPRARQRPDVPLPPGEDAPRPRTGEPGVPLPPSGPRLILPQGASAGGEDAAAPTTG